MAKVGVVQHLQVAMGTVLRSVARYRLEGQARRQRGRPAFSSPAAQRCLSTGSGKGGWEARAAQPSVTARPPAPSGARLQQVLTHAPWRGAPSS